MSGPKTYRALADGYDGQSVIKAGELFTTSIPAGKWMEEVTAAGEAPADDAPKPTGRKPAGRTSVDETDG